MANTDEPYITLSLLAGVYVGGRANLENMLTHSIQYFTDNIWDWVGETTLCGKIPLEHIADDDSKIDEPPTCTSCLRKDPRFIKPTKR